MSVEQRSPSTADTTPDFGPDATGQTTDVVAAVTLWRTTFITLIVVGLTGLRFLEQ